MKGFIPYIQMLSILLTIFIGLTYDRTINAFVHRPPMRPTFRPKAFHRLANIHPNSRLGAIDNSDKETESAIAASESSMEAVKEPVPASPSLPFTVLKTPFSPLAIDSTSFLGKFIKFLKSNWLVVGEIIVIAIAKTNPELGATGGPLKPELFISKLGVLTIFFINGIALSLSGETAMQTMSTNVLIQLYNFGFIPIIFKLLARFYPEPAFRDGLLVLAALPCTINICVAQTNAAGGNMTTAIFNAIFSNVVGVILTPLLAVWLLGAGGGVSLLGTLRKLGAIVILPLIVGQLARRTPLLPYAEKFKAKSRTLSSCLLLAIVYNVFSDTFKSGLGVTGSALAGLIVFTPALYLALTYIFWEISKKLLPGLDASTRSAAMFCSSQKTLAFGIPFIKTALGHRGDIAYILAPLLMYAPAQLLLGSGLLVPRMVKLIAKEEENSEGMGI